MKFVIDKDTDVLECDLTKIPMQIFSQMDNVENPKLLKELKKSTPSRIGIGRTGARYKTISMLRFLADQQCAADAVFSEVPQKVIEELGLFEVQTMCKDKYEMVTRPDLGRLFDEKTKQILLEKCAQNADVQIYIGDGLSSPAVEANAKDLLPCITTALEYEGITVGTPFFVRYCRVNTARTVSELLHPKVTIVFIGERPGLLTAQSMSAYMAYNATYDMLESQYTVISNISGAGMPPVEAAAQIVDIIKAMLVQKTSGYRLKV